MQTRGFRASLWIAAWLALAVAGALLLIRQELASLREDFDVQARIAHRLLSQRAAQHDAILATLALLQPDSGHAAIERLPAIHPQILRVRQRAASQAWAAPELAAAEAQSRALRRPVLASVDLAQGRCWLVLAAHPASFALQIDLKAALASPDAPARAQDSRTELVLEQGGEGLVLQPALQQRGWWAFEVRKPLASDSQPFQLGARRQLAWDELPWTRVILWLLLSATLLALGRAWQRQRQERQRAEELLRLGQVHRLNTLGELGAGLAHELNQPLTAILADSQAAVRLLDQDPPELSRAQQAMGHAAQQAKRAAEVVQRLHRTVERRDPRDVTTEVDLRASAGEAIELLEPELARRGISVRVEGDGSRVKADPVAVEQVIHNLLLNALQALEQVPAGERRLLVRTGSAPGVGTLAVEDSGPGIAAEHLQRIFEPFFTTRSTGLGLGLSLCQSLAEGMGGALRVQARRPRGARFELSLPLVSP